MAGGYPSLARTEEIVDLYVKGGCDAIEWSLPPRDPYIDPPYIAEKMRIARSQCDDYNEYLKKISAVKSKYPSLEIILLLYKETIIDIKPSLLTAFCRENGIKTILSGNLDDDQLIKELMEGGLKIASSINYTMYQSEIDLLRKCNGFIYVQAMPTESDLLAGRGRETLPLAIARIRQLGIDRPIYCGVGIRKPEDVRYIKQCGGQGFFLGSVLIKYYNEQDKLVETIKEYKEAAD